MIELVGQHAEIIFSNAIMAVWVTVAIFFATVWICGGVIAVTKNIIFGKIRSYPTCRKCGACGCRFHWGNNDGDRKGRREYVGRCQSCGSKFGVVFN